MKKVEPHIERARQAHHKALETLAQKLGVKNPDGMKLWRKLRKIEREASDLMVRLCNDASLLYEEVDTRKDKMTAKVQKIFGGKLPKGFFINQDPRGYMLKIDSDEFVPEGMQRDWGQYGILAPSIES